MESLEHLKNLVIMAAADGSMAEREIAWLVDRCTQLGLDEGDLETAIEFALSDKASIRIPETKKEQLEMLGDLIKIMAADGKLSEVEKRLFALASAKMGVEKEEINQLIDKLLANL
jgi:uncharacterized membrane protein YebE (DUF533 family)